MSPTLLEDPGLNVFTAVLGPLAIATVALSIQAYLFGLFM